MSCELFPITVEKNGDMDRPELNQLLLKKPALVAIRQKNRQKAGSTMRSVEVPRGHAIRCAACGIPAGGREVHKHRCHCPGERVLTPDRNPRSICRSSSSVTHCPDISAGDREVAKDRRRSRILGTYVLSQTHMPKRLFSCTLP
jgi:hypothetical protein